MQIRYFSRWWSKTNWLCCLSFADLRVWAFRLAHQNWYDHPISENRLDALFKDYLARGTAPYWVNDFARKAHDKFKAGELNYKDYGIKRRICDRRTKITGWIIISFLVLLLSIYSYLITRYPSYWLSAKITTLKEIKKAGLQSPCLSYYFFHKFCRKQNTLPLIITFICVNLFYLAGTGPVCKPRFYCLPEI